MSELETYADELLATTIAPATLDQVGRLSPQWSVEFLEEHAVLPLRVFRDTLLVSSWLPAEGLEVQVLDDLCLETGAARVRVVAHDESLLRQAIRRAYGSETTAEGVIAGMSSSVDPVTTMEDVALDDLVSMANEAPVVKLVNLLLVEALDARASDLHLESGRGGVKARYRIDGVLHDAPSPPAPLAAAIVSRMKIMADLDIAERRVPQDGRMRLRLRDRDVDVRVSIVPTLGGESVVLRLLDKDSGRISLDQLGMPEAIRSAFLAAARRPHGIVLATGPTGSGKTTSLYAAVESVRTGGEKILTVEDPVEYELAGVAQVPVREKIGVTFASALRALLRQDPDVLMVGEIRDGETAQIAIQASLTGHLVLSTLHTNDAASALSRLIDLGIAPFLVASTVNAVLAQRLVRRFCAGCRGAGCERCARTGFMGRIGIYELLQMDDTIREALRHSPSANDLARLAQRNGMRTLRDAGEALVAAGITSLEEVARVTQADA